ncbi:hypothetical protein DPMN_017085 [Dreissena polymorpha]|uniref:Dynamin-type G domain-containing protein n=1 Tax=Dreissena polymorpha TaxID=45954 RepID=A0A9D4S545_DREPO|nr:hypothetical protein DPMN_017085 [Dreissena polymorpha]
MAAGIYDQFNDTRTKLLQVYKELKDVTNDLEITIYDVNDTFRCAAIEAPEIPCCQTELTQKKLDSVMKMLNRTQMKISFFGRNSSGKSTLINALLGSNVLPSGMGHVTNCFVHLQGTDLPEGTCVTAKEPHIIRPIHSVMELTSALQDEHLATNSVVTVSWPKKECSLLARDVVMIDSPGCELDNEFDVEIKNQLKDSDVFILVINAECSLTRGESEFFRKVKNDISAANVFIVINRWDLIDNDGAPEKVKNQHLEKCKEFMRNNTHAPCKDEVERKIFFLSAQEKLRQTKPSTPAQKERHKAFATFEKALARSAFNSKCIPHINTAMDICGRLSENIEKMSKSISDTRKRIAGTKAEIKRKHDSLIQELRSNISSIEEEVQRTVFQFENNVSEALIALKKEVPSVVSEYVHAHDIMDILNDSIRKQIIRSHGKGRIFLNENLKEKLKDLTTMSIRKACEKKINEEMCSMLHKLNDLLKSCVSVEQEEPIGGCDINWDVENMEQLPNMTKKRITMFALSSFFKAGLFSLFSKWNTDNETDSETAVGFLTAFGVTAVAGKLVDQKLESKLQEQLSADAVKAIEAKCEEYKQRLSVQVKEFLGRKLSTIKDMCYNKLGDARTSEETKLADLLIKSHYDDSKIVFLREKIRRLKEKLALLNHLPPSKFSHGTSSDIYVTNEFAWYWFCLGLLGLVVVLMYCIIASFGTDIFG